MMGGGWKENGGSGKRVKKWKKNAFCRKRVNFDGKRKFNDLRLPARGLRRLAAGSVRTARAEPRSPSRRVTFTVTVTVTVTWTAPTRRPRRSLRPDPQGSGCNVGGPCCSTVTAARVTPRPPGRRAGAPVSHRPSRRPWPRHGLQS